MQIPDLWDESTNRYARPLPKSVPRRRAAGQELTNASQTGGASSPCLHDGAAHGFRDVPANI